MIQKTGFPSRTLQAYGVQDLDRHPRLRGLPEALRRELRVAATVFPFRVNDHVLEALVDWDRVPEDPIWQLAFPGRGMLEADDFARIEALLDRQAPREEIQAVALEIQARMNPHPAGQRELNVPHLDGRPLPGMQHKYRETVLFFPSQGQTCHAYCSYCFRWPQFVGVKELRFASRQAESLAEYVRRHPEVSDVLLTGGDPMVMRTAVLRRYVEPLLEVESVRTIRIGSKALAWWPYRFVSESDADDLLHLFEEVVASGRHLAFMAHFSHPVELAPAVTRLALRRIQDTGAVVRSQAPLIRRVNDDPRVWAEMWREQVRLGVVPYYMFVERDTGATAWFGVPLARALAVFQEALAATSGLARTVRGPSMSATPGKILVEGVAEHEGQPVFVLKFLQGRDPAWTNRIFLARFDAGAHWLDELQPVPAGEFFFAEGMRRLRATGRPLWAGSPAG